MTLTALPVEDWQRTRGQVRDFARRVREAGYRWEWAWAVERNPKGTGFHAHGIQWGDFVPQHELVDLWGGRVVDIRAMRQPGAGVYAVKEALRVTGYVVKGATEDATGLPAHLDRNGGRVAHVSRGFYGGLTKVEALRQVALEQASGEIRTWHLEPAV